MTLVEVMIGMAVLGTTALTALAGLLFTYRLADANLRSLAAVSLGRSVAEQLIALDYNSLLSSPLRVDIPSSSVGTLNAGTWNARTDDYRNTPSNADDDLYVELNPQVTRVSDSAGLDYVQVVVGIRWRQTSFFAPKMREDAVTVVLAPVSSY